MGLEKNISKGNRPLRKDLSSSSSAIDRYIKKIN